MGLCLCTAFCRAVGYSLVLSVDCRFLGLRAIVEKGADPVAPEDVDIEAHTRPLATETNSMFALQLHETLLPTTLSSPWILHVENWWQRSWL